MSNKSSSQSLLTVQQAADLLGVNPGTIRRWAQAKTMSGLKVGIRGDWRFTKDHVLTMAKTNIVQEINETRDTLAGADVHTYIDDERSNHENLVLGNALVPRLDWTIVENHEHFVQFYEDDVYLLDSLSRFIGMGLRENETCIVIATKEHRTDLDRRLEGYGIDTAQARLKGNYISLDAAETLALFMVDGMPDESLFVKQFSEVITLATSSGRQVRAFGEMVALLWAAENPTAALTLEKLWNDLQKSLDFSLYCAYPMHGFGTEQHEIPFADIGMHHTSVIPAESYTTLKPSDQLREIAILQQKARSLEAEVAKSRKLERQKDEFISLASHELKTPVTSLKVFTQMLQRQLKKEGNMPVAEHLAKMDTQITKLTTLIEDLLDNTKIHAGKLQFHIQEVALDTIIDEAIEELQRTTTRHVIKKKGSAGILLRADRDRIGQVLSNLLSNAIKYSPDADSVVVHVASDEKEVMVSVQDFGIGIHSSEVNHVFEQFYRSSKVERETYPGLGLGLYLTNEIIKRHHGRIWVESEEGKGTKVSFALPIQAN